MLSVNCLTSKYTVCVSLALYLITIYLYCKNVGSKLVLNSYKWYQKDSTDIFLKPGKPNTCIQL